MIPPQVAVPVAQSCNSNEDEYLPSTIKFSQALDAPHVTDKALPTGPYMFAY